MIKVVTKFNSDVTKRINNLTFKKMIWFFVAISLILIICGSVSYFAQGNNFGIFWMVFGVLFFPLVYLLTMIMQKKLNQSMSILSNETVETYTFEDDYVYIEQIKGEDFVGTTKAKYNYFYKALETKDCYYLYISKSQCHVFDKKSFTQGTPHDLSILLLDKLGPDKFKIK